MRSLRRALQSLQESQYIQVMLSDNGESATSAKLLKYGIDFQRQLRRQLEAYSPESAQNITLKTSHREHNNKGLRFLFSEEFQINYKSLCRTVDLHTANVLSKTIEETPFTLCQNSHFNIDDTQPRLSLVSDYFVHSSRKLETFYNIQRERKIWWMRYSADPSRYVVEPFETELECEDERLDRTFSQKCQSIKIKSVLPFNKVDMEHITLVPINELTNYINVPKSVALIRTTVNLDITTFGTSMQYKSY